MKATIVTMTQQLAKDYLKRNTQNRKVKKQSLLFYKNQMLSGKWKENGEPIIIDTNGVIKDGQHRLMAIAETGYAYRVPVISGVNPEVMDTIDTGSNRSAADVLHLEGFKYGTLTSSIAKKVLYGKILEDSSKKMNVSNSDILEWAKDKEHYLEEICKNANAISSLQVIKVLQPSIIGYYLYKYGNTEKTKHFLECITGTYRHPQSATDYVYKKLALSKSGDVRLSLSDKQQYIEKAYEKYLQGNPVIKSIKLNKKK